MKSQRWAPSKWNQTRRWEQLNHQRIKSRQRWSTTSQTKRSHMPIGEGNRTGESAIRRIQYQTRRSLARRRRLPKEQQRVDHRCSRLSSSQGNSNFRTQCALRPRAHSATWSHAPRSSIRTRMRYEQSSRRRSRKNHTKQDAKEKRKSKRPWSKS